MTQSGPSGTEPEIIEDTTEQVAPPPAEGLAALVFTGVALFLLVLAPVETQPQPADKGWYLAPVNWPVISLLLAVVSGAVLSWRFFAEYGTTADKALFRRQAFSAFDGLGRALEYSFWFCLYMAGVSYLGFALATLAFMQLVIWRAGLRGAKWVLTAILITLAIVIIFRLGIGLWFPLAPIFKLLPAWVGNTFGSVL